MKNLLDLLPKTKKLIDDAKKQPTNEDRIAALEEAIAELALAEEDK